MEIQKNDLKNTTPQKEFWDSLQSDILISGQQLTKEDLLDFTEKNFMFSLFFRGISHKELNGFQRLFDIKDSGYVIILDLYTGEKIDSADSGMNEHALYKKLKSFLTYLPACAVGPVVSNRTCILISDDFSMISENSALAESIASAKALIDAVWAECGIPCSAGIGNIRHLHSIYSSFIEALSCMHHCNPGNAVHVRELGSLEQESNYDYAEAEKHMLDALRLRKEEAYDYFTLLMSQLKPLNNTAKRNKIIEALVLAAHANQINGNYDTEYFNYTTHIGKIMELSDDDLIEWAYKRFMHITGYVKPQSSIDYSNKTVQATREYLEVHYSEEITLESVAEQVNISPQYFSKLIKKNTGFNFIDWLSMLRVKKAKELLTSSNYTVKEVCFLVGYKDPNYFSRIFKKRMGITPSDFVKNRVYINNTN